MAENNIQYFLAAGNRDNLADAEKEEMYLRVTSEISDFQASYKSVAVAIALYQKYKFYERDGMNGAKEYLLYSGYSKGAISHLLKFGAFIIKAQFQPHQIPSESLVRAILTGKNPDLWVDVYTAACHKHWVASESTQGKETTPCRRAMSAPAGGKNADSAAGIARECDADDEEGVEESVGDVGGENSNVETGDSTGDEASAADDSETPQSSNPVLDNIPTRDEIKAALVEYRQNDSKKIYLTAIGESMPREGSFTSDVLEKYKEKIKSVSLLCRMVNDFRESGGELTDADKTAIQALGKEIHTQETKALNDAIAGIATVDAAEETDEDQPDDPGDQD